MAGARDGGSWEDAGVWGAERSWEAPFSHRELMISQLDSREGKKKCHL